MFLFAQVSMSVPSVEMSSFLALTSLITHRPGQHSQTQSKQTVSQRIKKQQQLSESPVVSVVRDLDMSFFEMDPTREIRGFELHHPQSHLERKRW